MKESTIAYYDNNAVTFIEGTLVVDMSELRQKFLDYLPKAAHILDAGCGSGRDSLAFKDAGYQVSAIDGSAAMCEHTKQLIGENVRNIRFDQLEDIEIYEGIWACASLLHVPSDEIKEVVSRLVGALKEDGVLYVSLKYGDFEGERNGRYFTDYTENSWRAVVGEVGGIQVVEEYITVDKRPDREEKWLNVVMTKGLEKREGIDV